MRRHVVGTFGRVTEPGVFSGTSRSKNSLDIAPHIRIGVLLNRQRGRGVLDEDGQQTGLDLLLRRTHARTSRVMS